MRATGDERRRRLTLPPNGLSPAESTSPAGGSGSRFEGLLEDAAVSDDEDCLSEVPFEAAMEVLDPEEETEQMEGWTMVTRRVRKSNEELQQEFWNEIGYPTPASRTWECRSASPRAEVRTSELGMPKELASGSARHVGRTAGAPGGRNSPPGLSMGAAVSKPVKLGWRGPLPRPRISPVPVLAICAGRRSW